MADDLAAQMKRMAIIAKTQQEARDAAEALKRQHRAALAAEHGVAPERVLLVPGSLTQPAPLDPARVDAVRAHVAQMLADNPTLPPPKPERAAEPHPQASVACALCRGLCCSLGGHQDHFYLKPEALARAREAYPEADLPALYASFVPRAPMTKSCVFLAETGCSLPRVLRSEVCNTYWCTPMKEALEPDAVAPEIIISEPSDGTKRSARALAIAAPPATMAGRRPAMDMTPIDGIAVPDLAAIAVARTRLAPWTLVTPTLARADIAGAPAEATLHFKFELLQNAGTFKARGAFSNLLGLDDAARARGVTAISAGNHAIAVAYAAMRLGVSAKVVMLATANPARLALARRYGAEVLLAPDGASGFALVRQIEAGEGRTFVHPFNGLNTILGTATLGAEWAEQAGSLDAVVLPIGGGGLAAGAATALRQALPQVAIYGVEPAGADGMHQSFAGGAPVKMGAMSSIADSLMAPHTELYSYTLCRRAIDDLVHVDDAQLRAAMRLLFEELKIAVEPACAAATAAVLGPLRDRLAGKRVGVLLCGSNTDLATFSRHVAA